jgi:hypothetical protein
MKNIRLLKINPRFNTMRTILVLIAAVFIIAPVSCTRKGDGDPLISLRSRKARLDGKWKIVSGKGSTEINQTNQAWLYDGTTQIYSSGNVTDYVVTHNVEFGKDGRYEWKKVEEIPVSGGLSTIIETGTWNFKSGKDDTKRKELIVLQPEHVFPFVSGSTFPLERVFELHTLRNDKVVMKRSFASFNYNGYDPTALVNSEEWTLEPDNN